MTMPGQTWKSRLWWAQTGVMVGMFLCLVILGMRIRTNRTGLRLLTRRVDSLERVSVCVHYDFTDREEGVR